LECKLVKDYFLSLILQTAVPASLLATFGIRTGFSVEQLDVLNEFYNNVTKYPDRTQKDYLGKELGMTVNQVSIWFNNKRNKRKI